MNRRKKFILLPFEIWVEFLLNTILLISPIYLISTGCIRQTDTTSIKFVVPIDSLASQLIKLGGVSFDEVLNQNFQNNSITFFAHSYLSSSIYKVSIKDNIVNIVNMKGIDVPKSKLSFLSDTLVPFFSVIDSNYFVTADVDSNTLCLISDSTVISQIQLQDWQYMFLKLNTDIKIIGNHIFIPYQDSRYVDWQTSAGIREIYEYGKPLIYTETNNFREVKPFGSYPKEYIDNEVFGYNMYPQIAPFGEGYILSYPGAENMVIVSSTGEKIKEVNGASLDQIPYKRISKADFMVISKVIKWFAQTPLYSQFHYNSYRDEYYRIYQIPDKKGTIMTYNLIRLNHNLVKTQEYRIPAKFYNFQVFVSTPRGFAIKLRYDSTNIDNTRNSLREFYLN